MPWRDTESGTLWIPQSCSAPLLMVTYTDQYWNSIDVSTATTHEYNVGALSFDTSVDLRGTFDIATSYLGLLGETQVLVDMSLVGRGLETPMRWSVERFMTFRIDLRHGACWYSRRRLTCTRH